MGRFQGGVKFWKEIWEKLSSVDVEDENTEAYKFEGILGMANQELEELKKSHEKLINSFHHKDEKGLKVNGANNVKVEAINKNVPVKINNSNIQKIEDNSRERGM